MTYSGSTEGFRSAGRVLISQALAQLQLAQRYPLTVSCSGEARYLDPALRFTPQLIAVVDAYQGLVMAGEVSNGGVTWVQPVASDAEARAVVTLACRQRAEAQHLADLGRHAEASGLRRQAAATEGRLVDPFWRDAAQLALLQRRAA